MKKLLPLFLLALAVASCKKDDTPATEDPQLSTTILSGISIHVISATYGDLKNKTLLLEQAVTAFNSSPGENELSSCKQYWREARAAWEQSEGFLFGPVSSENIDPRIDTWPVNFNDLDSVLASTSVFTAGYIDSLDDALKGFHPVEYLLFGLNGNKTAAQITTREKEYLVALTHNLSLLTSAVADRWNTNIQGNYALEFMNAGNGSSVYSAQRAAYEELVNAMIGICEEVADGKIGEPFQLQNPSLEESPFAFNSITDFTNNIRSVENVYLGRYASDGQGLEDLVRQHNLSLDNNLKQKIASASAALGNITVPFGQAITQQPVQVQNAINAIHDLQEVLENDLLPFVQQYIN